MPQKPHAGKIYPGSRDYCTGRSDDLSGNDISPPSRKGRPPRTPSADNLPDISYCID
jgi:hypothetical protein